VSIGRRYSLFPRSLVSEYMSSPCAYYSLYLHSTSLRQLLPPFQEQVRPLSNIRSIYGHTSRYREQRTTVLSAQNALPHHVPDPPLWDPLEHTWRSTNLCTGHTHSIHPTYYVVRPFCALVSTHESMGPALGAKPVTTRDPSNLGRHKLAWGWRSRLHSANPALAVLISIERILNTISNRRTCRDRWV